MKRKKVLSQKRNDYRECMKMKIIFNKGTDQRTSL